MEKRTRRGQALYTALCWTLVLAVMTVIFCLSGQDETKSSKLSIDKAEQLFRLFMGAMLRQNDPWFTFLHTLVRKTAHVLLYAALSASMCNALSRYPLKSGARLSIDLLVCTLYAMSDEWHQTFIPGRAGRAMDVGIDFIGVLLGAAFFFGVSAIVRAVRERSVR